MAWQQLREPNLDPYIKQGGNTLTDWLGWCLAYTQTAFSAGWSGSNAWDGWNNHTVNKHEDRELPAGVFVPIWFSGYHGLGHSAIYKDGQVWSSPISHKATADVWGSISEVEQKYGVTYVGWSEGLGGTQVVSHQPDAPQYTITPIEHRQLRVRANHYKWNLAQPTFEAVVANPITTSDSSTVFTAVAELKRADFPQYTYYLDDANTPHGWNAADTEPVAVAPMPAPYTPPAAPVTAPLAKKYTLLTTVMYFGNASDAQFRKNGIGTLAPKEYYLSEETDIAVHLGDDNMHAKYWVSKKDNVAPEIVPVNTNGWKASYKPFYPEQREKYDNYELQMDTVVKDLDNKGEAFFVSAYKPNSSDNAVMKVYGWFIKDGVKYYRLHDPEDIDWIQWYAIPFANKVTGKPYLLKYSEVYDTTPKHDYTDAELALAAFARLGYRVIDGVVKFPSNIKKWLAIK